MDTTTANTIDATDPPIILPAAGSAFITFDKICRTSSGTLLVHISEGNQRWMVELSGRQLNSFGAFRAAVADAIGLWVDHFSQDSRRATERREDWHRAVADAFNAGART